MPVSDVSRLKISFGHACTWRRMSGLLTAILVLASMSLSGCSQTSGGREQIVVNGSTTILPIAEIAAEDFTKANPDTKVLVSGVGSSAGIESVSSGSSDIGTSSRDLKPEEDSLGLIDTPIAYDAIAVIVNPANHVRKLTTQQVKDIFMGKITNWKQVGGSDLTIGLVNRDEASGTREAFSKVVLDSEDFDPSAVILPGTGQVRAVVGSEASAIGYISLGFVNSEVRAVSIDGVEPTVEAVTAGTYPITRVLHFFTAEQPTGLAKRYIDFVLSPSVQDTVVRDAGFIPISARSQSSVSGGSGD